METTKRTSPRSTGSASTRRVRAEPVLRGLVRFVVSMVLSCQPHHSGGVAELRSARSRALSETLRVGKNAPALSQNHLIACTHTRGTRTAGSDCGLSLLLAHAALARTRKPPSWPADTPKP